MRIVEPGRDLTIFHQGDRFFIMERGACFFINGVLSQIDPEEARP